jgi:(2S)-methylsuccinyl-CoA dehydrogenase
LFTQLENYLNEIDFLCSHFFKAIKEECSKENFFNYTLLDQFQHISYELAFCIAELSAAKAHIKYCQTLNANNESIEAQQALYFGAEVIQQSKARLFVYQNDLGLNKEYDNCFNNDNLNSFCQKHLKHGFICNLADALIKQNGENGASVLDKEKEMIRSTFKKLGEDIVAPQAEHIHRNDLCIPDEIINALNALGCFALSIPERYEGIQPDDKEDNLGMIVVTEELSQASLGAAGSLITRPEILARALLKGGTETQKQNWLPRIAVADPLVAIAVTEPDTGSDVASVKLRATKCDGGWLLNGNKTWCTMAGKAGVLMTLARTDNNIKPKHKGLTTFLVEKPVYQGHEFDFQQEQNAQQKRGRLSGKAIATIGYRGMHSFELFFDDFFVADANVMGEDDGIGKGFYYTMAGFEGGRIQTAARATGVMQAAYQAALKYSQERKVFGQSISDYQLSKIKLARMATLTNVCRQYTYQVAQLMDEGKGKMEASLVKLFACKTSEWITREALQLHGGMGYAEESAVSRYYVDARVLSIFEGAEETLALKVIAKTLIEQV